MSPKGDRLDPTVLTADAVTMRVIASPDAVELIREAGGRVFVWVLPMDAPTGGAVFALEASTDSPGAHRSFTRFGGDAFDVLIDTEDRGLPEELHLAVRGWRRRRIRAYWNGHSFGRT